ncbi:PH domain-containing protein [Candidatus Harpocratesius sp.]
MDIEESIMSKNLSPKQYDLLEQCKKYYNLDENEQILEVLQRNTASYYIPRFIRGLIFILIFLILRYLILYKWIEKSSIVIDIANWLLLLWSIYYSISLSVGVPFTNGHIYIITTKRIILIRKFLGILYREIEYKRITDLVLHQSIFGRYFNFGNLMPVTAGIEMGTMRMGMYSIEGIQDVFRIRVVVISQIQRIQEFLLEKFHPNKKNKNSDENSSSAVDSITSEDYFNNK